MVDPDGKPDAVTYKETDKVKRDLAIAKLKEYGIKKSPVLLKEIMAIIKPVSTEKAIVAEKAEIAAVAEKKKVKHQIKEATVEAKVEIKEAKKSDSKRKQILEGLLSTNVLQVNGLDYFLYGYPSVKMPELLVDRFVDYVVMKHDVQPLINFWMWCLLNPNKIARYKLFAYISKHKLIITPSGYFVTYRMVKSTTTSEETGIYVDAHTGMFEHIIGQVSRMDRKDCDEDGAKSCSRGIHTGSPDFIGISLGEGYEKGEKQVKTRSQGGGYGTGYAAPDEYTTQKFDNTFGNQAVIAIVNPMHVVSIPNSDTRKLRASEIFIAKKTTAQEVIDHLTMVDYLIFDNEYAQIEAKAIEAQLKDAKLEDYSDGTVEKLTKTKGSPAKKQLDILQNKLESLSSKVMQDKIADDVTLEEMMKVIQSRVTQVANIIPILPESKRKGKPIKEFIDKIESNLLNILGDVKGKKASSNAKDTSKVEEKKVDEPKTVPTGKANIASKPTKVESKPSKGGVKPSVVGGDSDRVKNAMIKEFVDTEWNKKKKAKKSPKSFNVLQLKGGTNMKITPTNSEYDSTYTLLGNLDELYNQYK